jgi:hypothetical protein
MVAIARMQVAGFEILFLKIGVDVERIMLLLAPSVCVWKNFLFQNLFSFLNEDRKSFKIRDEV